jgi:excisionase family DNA binding protein
MSEEVYTVEQFAERLKLHPKTVLRFIKEGRLRAVKVGRSYRIFRSDLEAFGGFAPASRPVAPVRVTAIVDVPDLTPEEAQHLARLVTSARSGADPEREPMSINVTHDPVTRQVKVVLVGSPRDVSAMLAFTNLWLEQGR